MTLEMLKEMGLISTSFEVVNSFNFKSTTLSELAKMPARRITKRLNVVVDKPDWIAISQDEDEKDLVISCKNEKLFIWNKTLTKLVTQQLINDNLATIKIENYGEKDKEENFMETPNIDLSALGDLTAFEEPAAAVGGEISGATQLDQNLHIHSQQFGRFIAPIVKEEAIVKVGIQKKPKIGADGKYVIADDADPDKIAKAKETGTIPASIAEKEPCIGFKESKPTLVGALLSIPESVIANSTSPIDDAIAGKLEIDKSIKSSRVMVTSKEEMFTTINILFGGRIREDERVNANPQYLQTRTTETKKVKEDGSTSIKLNSSLVVENGGRKSVITETNFIPLKLYKKVSPQNPTQEEADWMNMNIESAIKTAAVYDTLVSESKADIKWDDTAEKKVTSVYFQAGKAGKPIEVKRFFDKDQVLTNVQIPVRTKEQKPNKAGELKTRYSFETYKVDDLENGTFSKPEYKEILDKVGMSVDDFLKEVKLSLQTRTSKSKGKSNVMPMEDYYNMIATKNRSGQFDIKGAATLDTMSLAKKFKGLY